MATITDAGAKSMGKALMPSIVNSLGAQGYLPVKDGYNVTVSHPDDNSNLLNISIRLEPAHCKDCTHWQSENGVEGCKVLEESRAGSCETCPCFHMPLEAVQELMGE